MVCRKFGLDKLLDIELGYQTKLDGYGNI